MKIGLLIFVIIITVIEFILFRTISRKGIKMPDIAKVLIITVVIWGLVIIATLVPYLN